LKVRPIKNGHSQPQNSAATGISAAECSVRCELARARVIARSWSETLVGHYRSDQAALFTHQVLNAFATVIAPQLELSAPFKMPFGRLDATIIQIAESIGKRAASLSKIEGLSFITSLYPALLSGRERSELGAFYTPAALTTRLLDQATELGVDWARARVMDPAAGGGAFLMSVAIRMREAMTNCEPTFICSQIGSRLLGLEIDSHAASIAQWALEILLSDLTAAGKRTLPQIVRVCDTLDVEPEETFDLVVGNPPYGRISLTPEQRRRYERSLYGHANLYGVFTDIALRWTRPNGSIAYLTPTSFLAGQYYGALRKLLAKEAPPVAIDFVHARRGVFEDVQQETMLAVYRKGAKGCRAQIHYLHVNGERDVSVAKNGTVGLPADPAMPWLAPRDSKHSALISHVESMSARLADWGYSVSTGPLVWNRFKTQLRNKLIGHDVHPLVWAEAVTAGGQFIFRAQKRNHAPYFKLESGDGWLLVEQPCVLVQRTTAKEQVRRLIAAELPEQFIRKHRGVVVENHLNMIRANSVPKVSAAVVAAIVNSQVVDQIFRCMNGSVAVSAFELEALPLPDISELKMLKRLVARGAKKEKIDDECCRLYGGTTA
jgi:adenine-specific DNA-methyltransferase